MIDTELEGLLVESLQRLTEHLDEQNERIENLTTQLNDQATLNETLRSEQGPTRIARLTFSRRGGGSSCRPCSPRPGSGKCVRSPGPRRAWHACMAAEHTVEEEDEDE
jgi:hypothetical protein